MTELDIQRPPPIACQIVAEAVGSFLLFATVVGSGIMAERLAGGNDAVALLANTIATGAILFVLITMLAPISGAQMNPAVSIVAALRRTARTMTSSMRSCYDRFDRAGLKRPIQRLLTNIPEHTRYGSHRAQSGQKSFS